ncbi:MAG: bifunctional demethylmenaquinone methyltransferase/2-methoxy-6-polyprenyl-1,4-benzoquinol methylase UbiE [Flavobacteriales bacterium]|nr:bifunctional demethylmenaquinone methyltransferase/2-methoxy-6-polyprenyl-1,4-benzoquinol methylase UbiE [Flavobacteriales bacterium]
MSVSKVTPYKNSTASKKEQVAQMFDTISGEYDSLNRVISFGTDVSWRKKVIQIIASAQPTSVIDIATGTGDLAIMMNQTSASRIVGLDISAGMLEIGKQKIKAKNLDGKIEMILGDSENIPFEDQSFSAATVSFGIRNFENLTKGLAEILRILKSGGQLVILETSVPTKAPFKQFYNLHSKILLPLIGKLFSKDKKAYSYLSESASVFPYGEKLKQILLDVGFDTVSYYPQTFGAATIYVAKKQ